MEEGVDITTLGALLERTIDPFEERRVATLANKQMPARETRYDGDLATDIAVQRVPAPGAYITVVIGDGFQPTIGNGTKLGCMMYFSGDLGRTARRWGEVQKLDTLHFNGSVAGEQLAATDRIDLHFEEGMA